MPSPRGHESRWRSVLHILWMVPLIAVPFAVFFGTLNGASRDAFVGSYVASLYFGYAMAFAFWSLESFVLPRLGSPDDALGGKRMPVVLALKAVASLLGAFVASLALRFTIAPHFLGGPRDVALVAMFTLLFTAVFVGIASATVYYRKALVRAGADRELQLARRIQRSFLISEFPRRARIQVHAVNLSSKEMSGDLYDVVPAGDDAVVLVIADVSGKGVPAALLSSMLQGLVRIQAGATASPAAAMRMLNALACQREDTGQFATIFLAVLDERSMTLRYTNGGHNPPVLLRANGERLMLETGGLLVGVSATAGYEEGFLELHAGDRLVLYTDGVTEAARRDDEMFGDDRLLALLADLPADLEASAIVDRVLDGVREFLGELEAGDDVTVMAVRVLDPARAALNDGPPARAAITAGAAIETAGSA